MTEDKEVEMTLCGNLAVVSPVNTHRKVKEAVDRDGTKTQRSTCLKEDDRCYTRDLVTVRGKF